MLEGGGVYNNDTWVIRFSKGKVHGEQADLFSRGSWGTDGARLSIVTLKVKETVSVEVNRNRMPDWETKPKQMTLVNKKWYLDQLKCKYYKN